MEYIEITENTPIACLTVGQFREIIGNMQREKNDNDNRSSHYVRGIKGIRDLFNISHKTAWKYKETIIKDAVHQQGRVIITDVERARELFANYNTNKKNRK